MVAHHSKGEICRHRTSPGEADDGIGLGVESLFLVALGGGGNASACVSQGGPAIARQPVAGSYRLLVPLLAFVRGTKAPQQPFRQGRQWGVVRMMVAADLIAPTADMQRGRCDDQPTVAASVDTGTEHLVAVCHEAAGVLEDYVLAATACKKPPCQR